MKTNTKYWTVAGLAILIAPIALLTPTRASDHADTPTIASRPGTDLTDVFMFPSATDPDKVVLAMTVHPLIIAGQGRSVNFDPNVLYQFKIDNNGDAVEDLVIQARFKGSGPNQKVKISRPSEPERTGSINTLVDDDDDNEFGHVNRTFRMEGGMKVFAGGREDPFFFDLEQFFNIFPDRATPLTGIPISNPNTPQLGSWRPAGSAVDFLSNGGYNVLSIVVEVPKSKLLRRHSVSTVVGLWCTTSTKSAKVYRQQDRLARPVVNEVFATVANNRHQVNNMISPKDDKFELKNDIESFLVFPANRSVAIRNVIKAVLVPDMLMADFSGSGAAYLGFETGGATGGTFGGRKLTDDVVDISLGVVFGTTISDLGLAPADGHEIPSLTSDNVGAEGKHFLAQFPYLGNPR
jgi:hypothetical protein